MNDPYGSRQSQRRQQFNPLVEPDVHRDANAGQDDSLNTKLISRLFHDIEDPFVQVNMTGRYIGANDAYRKMVGYSQRELAEMTYPEITPARWHEFEADIIEHQVLKRGFSDIYEKEYRRKDGVVFPIELRTILQRDSDGNPIGMWAIVRDISARKAVEGELRAIDTRKDEFLATLAHELRNPLSPIHNGIQALLTAEKERLSNRGKQMLTIMERQSGHLVRLLDDLMEVSRIRLGKVELHKEKVNVDDLLRDAVKSVSLASVNKGQNLSLKLGPDETVISGDPTRLAQVFLNLLSNAVKFTPAEGAISVLLRKHGPEVEISIVDNGPGIPPDALKTIFDMFSQGGNAFQSESGLGIGLALAAKLVDMHGGRIEAKSDGQNKGSEFVVTLPIGADSEIIVADAGSDSASSPRKRVLIIDDEKDVADGLRFLLEGLGADVQVAYGGYEGLAIANDFVPNIIFVDLGMPDLNGLEVCSRLRNVSKCQHATIVALTGWGQEQDRAKTRAAGFDLHFTKPATLGALQELLLDR